MSKLDFDLCDEQITELTWGTLEKEIGYKLPLGMKKHYMKFNGGQPTPSCVHDKNHLFPVNAFDSVDDIIKNFKWATEDSLPVGFKVGELITFAYDPGSGSFAVSLKEEELGRIYFYVLEEEASIYGEWDSFEEFINSFVEEPE
ncbi:SMI1/KNR4 family protein [uncultured Shewanella sp.]|uniref:SMI1/KNR4 family protein n=1 Tax=uncultured Shewanella sp. TaxID=173975 RepID=UPI0026119E27|nr:SMI1/KNR4 family protein [uncultured Shewanella sp.]